MEESLTGLVEQVKTCGVTDRITEAQIEKRRSPLDWLLRAFDIIRSICQSVDCSTITKKELVDKIISYNLDIEDPSEVEEQLNLLEELVPDWICKKGFFNEDFFYCIKRLTDPDSVRARLSKTSDATDRVIEAQTLIQPNSEERQFIHDSLPTMFDTIHSISQSVDCSLIMKQELVHKIISNNLDIEETSEVEEQLGLLEDLVPDWICMKSTFSGEFLYCIKHLTDQDSVRARLSDACADAQIPIQLNSEMRKYIHDCLLTTFDIIHSFCQSADCSSFTKRELLHQICSFRLDILHHSEAEEQLSLLEVLFPDWICKRGSFNGEFCYCIKRLIDPDSVRAKLSEAV